MISYEEILTDTMVKMITNQLFHIDIAYTNAIIYMHTGPGIPIMHENIVSPNAGTWFH